MKIDEEKIYTIINILIVLGLFTLMLLGGG